MQTRHLAEEWFSPAYTLSRNFTVVLIIVTNRSKSESKRLDIQVLELKIFQVKLATSKILE
jgi:hypothetical protein